MGRQAESLGMSEVRVSRETTVSVVRARCRRSGTMGRGARGRPLPSDTLPPPPLGRPLRRVGQAHLSRGVGAAAGGDTQAHGAGWTARPRGGDGGRAGSGPSPLLHWGALQPRGCSRRGDRVPRLDATPLPRDQPCSRSVTCRERGARAELELRCRRGGCGAGRSSACARAGVSGAVDCCDSSE